MIDHTKIPKSVYNELVNLIGKENAEGYIEKQGHNYGAITNKIILERLKQRFGKRFWIYFWFSIALIAIVYFIMQANFII